MNKQNKIRITTPCSKLKSSKTLTKFKVHISHLIAWALVQMVTIIKIIILIIITTQNHLLLVVISNLSNLLSIKMVSRLQNCLDRKMILILSRRRKTAVVKTSKLGTPPKVMEGVIKTKRTYTKTRFKTVSWPSILTDL